MDLLFRSAAFRGHWGTNRGPKEQVRATRSVCPWGLGCGAEGFAKFLFVDERMQGGA